MQCPKCEIGTIKKVKFKANGEIGYLCDYCDALWLENERINLSTGHTLRSYSQDRDLEYTIEELDEEDFEDQPITNSKH